jgi:hypothetical protein
MRTPYHKRVSRPAARFVRKGEGAQGVIEFALIITALLLVFLGTVDFSRFLYYDTAVRNAARVGAEAAINHCFNDTTCDSSATAASNDFVLWSVFCEAEPFDILLPTYGTSGVSAGLYRPTFLSRLHRANVGGVSSAGPSKEILGALPLRKPFTPTPLPATPTFTPVVGTVTNTPIPSSTPTPNPSFSATPTPSPVPTATPVPTTVAPSRVCLVPPGSFEILGGTNYSGDQCVDGCSGSSGADCVYDVCVAPVSGRASGQTVTVTVGYEFDPISFAISSFFRAQSCWSAGSGYSADTLDKDHTLCASSTGTISP